MQPSKIATSRQRFLAGILGEMTDRIPVASVTSVANIEQKELTGAYFPDVHLEGEKMVLLAAGAYEILEYDAIMPYFSIQAEAGALGCDVDWGDRSNMPVEKRHPWRDPADICIPNDFLEKPSVKAVIDAIHLLMKRYGDQVAIVGKVMGPWTISYHTHGTQNFLINTILELDFVRTFLEKLKEITVLFGKTQLEAGADVLCLADYATGDLASLRTYRDFLLPIHQELTERLNCPTVLHICGNTYDRPDDICISGFNTFHFNSKVEAKKAVERVTGRIALVGNINNPLVMLNGSSADVEEVARHTITASVNVIGPECAIPLQTPLVNLRAIRQIVSS